MPQLTIFCKALQSEDISLEGVLVTYQVTRATFLDYKADIKNMPFLRRFVASVLSGSVPNLLLPTLALPESSEYRACVAGLMHKIWDSAVRVPCLGHLARELFEVFSEAEPTVKPLLV